MYFQQNNVDPGRPGEETHTSNALDLRGEEHENQEGLAQNREQT